MADAIRGGIVINEILPDPNSAAGSSGPRFDTDLSGAVTPVDEFIEVYNSSDAPIDLSGLQLWDQTLGNWFTFPPGSVLAPGAHAMVMAGAAGGPGPLLAAGDLAFYAGRGSAVLNNGPENAILYDPLTNQFIQVAYGGATIQPPGMPGVFAALPAGASRIGAGEDFGAFVPGYSLQRMPDGGDTIVNGRTPNPASDNVCFARGTRIATPHGPRAVEDLRAGDLVLTSTEAALPVIWAGRSRFDAARLWREPRLWPVTIRAGTFGPGLPAHDLRVSRQHRLRFGGKVARRMGGDPFVLVPAHVLVGLPGVHLARPEGDLEYHHLLLPRHAILLAEDLPAESLYLGPQALSALNEEAHAELALIFPDRPWEGPPPAAAHPMLSAARARGMLRRHARNEQNLRPGA